MNTEDEGYVAREHDHLVEPFYGGLHGKERSESLADPACGQRAEPSRGLVRRLVAFLLRKRSE